MTRFVFFSISSEMGAREQVESKYGAGDGVGRGKSTFFIHLLATPSFYLLHVSEYLEE